VSWPAAALLLVGLTAVWAWWAWRDGAYFGIVFYPGLITLGAITLLLLFAAPLRTSLRRSPAAAAAAGALAILGGWTLLSAAWSPVPDEATADAARVFAYPLVFVLGAWLANLLGRHVLLSLLPLAAAAGGVALATAIALPSSEEVHRWVELSGTLFFPIGYRNANAAFFLIALWPALTLAATPTLDWRLRGAMLGSAVLCIEVAVLAQSRGSALAVPVGLFLWLLLSPWRVRALCWLALAALPAAVALPQLLDVYQSFRADQPFVPELEDSRAAMLLSFAAAVVLGAIAARFEPAARDPASVRRSLLRPLIVGLCAAVVVAAASLIVAGKDPLEFASDRAHEVGQARSPDLPSSARFGVDATSMRSDIWRVAWDEALDEPLRGGGAGSFEFTYLRDRGIALTARDGHSVELELVSELGFPALAMFAVAIVAAAAGALRSRRIGPAPAGVGAAALAAGGYWLVHTSIDWFWTYPAVTAPVFALLGGAAAPALSDLRARWRGGWRIAAACVVGAVMVAVVPLYLSERYTRDAYQGWRDDLPQAYDDFDRAAALNPWADEPLQLEGSIARQAGDRARAIASYREAIQRVPDDWASHFLLGQLLAADDPEAARREFALALELNPDSKQVKRTIAALPDAGGPDRSNP
jgi:hypothetical protein